ncbi:hypothetical protein CPB83DRAFT_946583 [Crepidotus variabilis]|uniref:Uncharacterized protein n=1 Tax=Crepidotus variabilis TaxID=179855 RepID=A0A9P6E8E9_9AGAR|nr:hypothetical protein CPB83DRAFT_946583 [Crepidotus variabilis]
MPRVIRLSSATENRFEMCFQRKFYISLEKSWKQKTLEELDKIPTAISDGKPKDEMEIAAQMLSLADAYWEQYKEHYGSEGPSRGQDLNQSCYELLWENLGQWSSSTQDCLRKLCRWDIENTERTIIVDRFLTQVEQKQNQWNYPALVYDLLLCCCRNDDYSDRVKALFQLYKVYLEKDHILSYRQSKWPKLLGSLYVARQEWDKAETLAAQYPALTTHHIDCTEAKEYAYQGEIQMKRGYLVDGELTLRKGMEAELMIGDATWKSDGHFLCCEHLLNCYLQQGRWNDAERLGLHLIQAKEKYISDTRELSRDAASHWDNVTQKAARVIRMSRWRALEWGTDAHVYFLHELYNNKLQLATAYMNMKRYNGANYLLEELMENKMHKENPILLTSRELLVNLLLKLGELDAAEKKQEEIIEAKSNSFGYDSDKLIPDLEKLVDICQRNKHLGKRHHVKLRLLRYR